MPGGGRAGSAGGVGGGRRHGYVRPLDDGPGHRVVGAAHTHRGQPRRHHIGDHGLVFQNHGQRSGPKPLRQGVSGVRDLLAVPREPVRGGDMEDQRVILRTAFGLENTGDGHGVQSVGPQAVNRLRRNGQQPAPAQDLRGGGQFFG
ncbi:hypothetical protein SDC9_161233 [bioreactor metagenome]|uniref:Uncharacterized protein n=1 Tax=bioreactor metagenome TaxID=1076179 RepID=A0A645FHS8_9ZZZZ